MLTLSSIQWMDWVMAFVFPLVRVLALVASTPLLGDAEVPPQTRIGIGVLVTVLVEPSIHIKTSIDPVSAQGVWLILQQMLIGALMGFGIRLVFSAVEMAGEITGLQMGLGFASFYDPQNAAFQPVLSQFFGVLISLIYLSVDGPLLMINALSDSFQVLPVGEAWVPQQNLQEVVLLVGSLFAEALQISLPMLAALMMANLMLGILTRSAPQLNLFAVGFPVTLAAGFVITLLSLPYMAPLVGHYFQGGVAIALQVIRQQFGP